MKGFILLTTVAGKAVIINTAAIVSVCTLSERADFSRGYEVKREEHLWLEAHGYCVIINCVDESTFFVQETFDSVMRMLVDC